MTEHWRTRLGRFGIWRSVGQTTPELAVGIEQAGYGALWLGGSPSADLAAVERLLDATSTLILATGIVNMWQSDAHEVAASFARIGARHPNRFLLGVGAGHREAIAGYARPYETLASYVDVLRADDVPGTSLVLAALGPKMLRLAAERAAGAHPYLVTPRHTEMARSIMGGGPLLAPEHKAVLVSDPARARAIARPRVRNPYLGLVNYTANLRRLGWTDEDLAGDGSDALIDALVAHGDPDDVAAHLGRHINAGADHVSIQLLTEPDADPMEHYLRLAGALGL